MGRETTQPQLLHIGVDEIYRGKKGKFLTVVCNLETGEPLCFGRERKKETLDDFFPSQLSPAAETNEAACVTMWAPPGCNVRMCVLFEVVYDNFAIMQSTANLRFGR